MSCRMSPRRLAFPGPPVTALALLASLALCWAAVLPAPAAEPLPLVSAQQQAPPPEIRVLEKGPHGVTLEFELQALEIEDVTVNGRTYQQVSIPGGGEMGAVGRPRIPVFNRFLQIPEHAVVRVSAEAVEEEEIPGLRLIPLQDEEAPGFEEDGADYARDDFGTDPAALTGASGRLRDLSVQTLTFAPVRYNPARGSLLVARRLRVRVDFEGEALTGMWADPTRPVATSFDLLYRRLVLNYDGPPPGVRVADGSWLCICVDNPSVISRLQPLADWHQRRGRPARIVTTAEAGTSRDAIRTYLQNAYDNWAIPPEYVVLAGDVDGGYSIPCYFTGSGEGDHPYTQLEGNDLIGDVHIGRLSFTDTGQLDVIVAKTIGYSTNPTVADPGWFTRATLVGDPSHSGLSTVMVMQWIKTRLREVGYTAIDTIFTVPAGDWVTPMRTSLNRGETVFCYRGYVGMSGWSNTDTNSLINFWKLPFGVMSTCGTGDFSGATSIAEGFLRAGKVIDPKGAIGAIGTATLSTHTRYNNCYTVGVWQGVLYEDQWEMGAAHTRGKTELFLNYGQADAGAATNFSTWNNLMGDPACQIWTASPTVLSASYADTIAVGASSFTVNVTEAGGRECAGAQVCLWKGTEIYAVGTTDAQGFCELPLSAQSAGTAKLTVTKHNCRPLLLNVPVASRDLYVSYIGSVLDDDQAGESLGDGDGRTEPGETLELRVQVRNFGTASAEAVTARLSSTDPYLTILDTDEEFGALAPGASAWCADDFGFTVSGGCPDGHVLRFGLDVTSGGNTWRSAFEVPVSSAALRATGVTVYDGDQRLDPGETLEISVPLHNEGGSDAEVLSAQLSSLSPWVTVIDGEGVYPAVPAGQSGENTADRFSVAVAPEAFQGHLAFFRLITVFNGGATDTTVAASPVGQASSDDPVGPDGYGYYAFDNTDTAYPEAPVYQWIEIDPAHGGDGTQVQLGDFGNYQDKSLPIDLPFPFRFYGETFTRATICSNGWMAMGETYLTDYRNWTIPGAGAPPNLIAAFWDDLRETTSGGHVYQKYDVANHRFIVEWSRMINEINSAQETFEMILLDPAYHTTESGNGMIEFQYNVVNQVDGTDGYATTGIQNWNHTVGLLYTYYNRYPAAAAPLAAGRAIRIVPIHVDVTGTDGRTGAPLTLAFAPAQPNPFAGHTDLSFALPQSVQIRLDLFDPQGRRVRALLSGVLPAGVQRVQWDGMDDSGRLVPAGIYFARLETEGGTLVRKLLRLE